MNKKALVIGINDYPTAPLTCCVNDANVMGALLEENGDEHGSKNFDVKLITDADSLKAARMKSHIQDLFANSVDVALFYFAGHGTIHDGQAYLCASNYDGEDIIGVRIEDIMSMISNSAPYIKNRILILDSCFSGNAGNNKIFKDSVSNSLLPHGTTILTASREQQVSNEVDGHGVFTNLVIDALQGAAADVLGRITPAAVYTHIDQSLGSWEQRPLFKSHVDEFLVLRTVNAKVGLKILKKLTTLFPTPDDIYPLTPEHEHTNPDETPRTDGNPKLQQEFKELQACNRAGLVVPDGAEHMYWAARNNKGCRLTLLGKHYHRLAMNKRL